MKTNLENPRETIIKNRVKALWKQFKGTNLRESSAEDLIILEDYVHALRKVPAENMEEIFRLAASQDRLPKPFQMIRFGAKPKSNLRPGERREPFPPKFRDYLNEVATTALVLQAETGDKDYRKICDMCNQADVAHGIIKYSKGLNAKDLYNLMHEWFGEAKIGGEKIIKAERVWRNLPKK